MKRHWIAVAGLVTVFFVSESLPSAHAQWGGFGRSSAGSSMRSMGTSASNLSNFNRSFQNSSTSQYLAPPNMQSSMQSNRSTVPSSGMVSGLSQRSSSSTGQAVPQMNLTGPNGRGNISIDAKMKS